MTDIQARLQDLHQRSVAAKRKRDREFITFITAQFILIAAAGVVFGLALDRAEHVAKVQDLDNQEQVSWTK